VLSIKEGLGKKQTSPSEWAGSTLLIREVGSVWLELSWQSLKGPEAA
jgi:hypothetical protein